LSKLIQIKNQTLAEKYLQEKFHPNVKKFFCDVERPIRIQALIEKAEGQTKTKEYYSETRLVDYTEKFYKKFCGVDLSSEQINEFRMNWKQINMDKPYDQRLEELKNSVHIDLEKLPQNTQITICDDCNTALWNTIDLGFEFYILEAMNGGALIGTRLPSHKEQTIFVGKLKPGNSKRCECGQACKDLSDSDSEKHRRSFRTLIVNPIQFKDKLPECLRAQKYLAEPSASHISVTEKGERLTAHSCTIWINTEVERLGILFDRDPRQYSWIAKILSNGVGRDSTTEIALNHAYYDEIVFSDTGSEQPETYEYLKYLIQRMPSVARHKFRIIHGRYGVIFDYYERVKCIPMVHARRDCTTKFKIAPIRRVYTKLYGINPHHNVRNQVPKDYKGDEKLVHRNATRNGKDYFHKLEMHLGINADEGRRVRGSGIWYAKNVYPLMEKDVHRQDEKEILTTLNWKIPIKSGCFFCPYGNAKYWKRQKRVHPDLYEKSVFLQDNAMQGSNDIPLDRSQGTGNRIPLRKKFINFDEDPNDENPDGCNSCFNGDMSEPDDDEMLDTQTGW